MTDFSRLTACGECCDGCAKKQAGNCPGCIEAKGRVPEWAQSGVCRVYACVKAHGVSFCGLCERFPCEELEQLIPWNPDIVRRLSKLRDEYRSRER